MGEEGRRVFNAVVTFGASGALAMAVVVLAARANPPAAAAEVVPPPSPTTTEPPRLERPPPSFASLFARDPVDGRTRTVLAEADEKKIVTRARAEIGKVAVYDNSWMQTSAYPGGDVPEGRGACTDVVVRALRTIGVDLQELVHEDIKVDIGDGAKGYKLSWLDHHIDHRRVTTMHTWFERNAVSLTTDVREKAAFRPGDVVFFSWSWGRSALAEHVAIVSDVVGPRGYRLLIQNGGPRPTENDGMDRPHMVGHYRALPKP